jgi:hypothetical protein
VEITDLRDIEWSGIDWVDLVQDKDQRMALVETLPKLRIA